MARARRGRGEGSVFQRGDGRWVARLTIGCDADGKPVRRTVYGTTKREAQDRLQELRATATGGVVASSKGVTLGEWCDHWLEAVKDSRRGTTVTGYRTRLDKHIKPFIGGVRLDRLEPHRLRSWLATLRDSGLGSNTRGKCHGLVKRILRLAVRDRIIPSNPMDAVDKPKHVEQTMTVLKRDEIQSVIDAAAGHRIGSIAILAVTTGMRRGELCALQWDDVDLEGGRLQVRHTLQTGGTLGPPKTDSSRRTIVLPDRALEALHERRRTALREGRAATAWVHPSTSGGPIGGFAHVWQPIRDAAGVSCRFHDLRHTAASMMLSAGVPVLTVSRTLGHQNATQTLNRYAHLMDGDLDRAAEAVNAALATA